MASIVGHGLVGALASCLTKTKSIKQQNRLMAFCASLALVADLDILIYLLLKPSGMTAHRGISHSILSALILASLSYFIVTRILNINSHRLLLALLVAAISHPICDFLMGAGPPIPFFAPFSSEGFLSSIKLIPFAFYSLSFQGLLNVILYPPALLGMALELLVFLPLIAIFRDPHGSRWNSMRKKRLLLISLMAQALVISIYNSSIIQKILIWAST